MNRYATLKGAALFAAFGLSSLFAPARAQSLYALDGTTSTVTRLTGPPAGACLFPDGPTGLSFGTSQAFGCPTPSVTGGTAAMLGDISLDKGLQSLWVTDGFTLGKYNPFTGAVFASYTFPAGSVLPGPILGLGADTPGQDVYMTDGSFFVTVSATGNCTIAPAIINGPIALPLAPGVLATDIELDEATGTLWICDTAGMVTNVTTTGVIGPGGSFSVVTTCGLTAPQGLAIDEAGTANNPSGRTVFWVTDGLAVAYLQDDGSPAPLTFYQTATCGPALGDYVGLCYVPTALTYGTGVDTSGLPAPTISFLNMPTQGSTAFRTRLDGSVPGAFATLFRANGALCPTITVAGLTVLLNPLPAFFTVANVTVGPGGFIQVNTAIPASVPVGFTVHLQWLALTSAPSLQVSNGGMFAVSF